MNLDSFRELQHLALNLHELLHVFCGLLAANKMFHEPARHLRVYFYEFSEILIAHHRTTPDKEVMIVLLNALEEDDQGRCVVGGQT